MTGQMTIFWMLLSGSAHAGTVSLQTDAPVEVQFGGTTIARASQAGDLTIGELPEGPITLRLIRPGKAPMDADLNVPASGPTTMSLVGDTLTVQGHVATMKSLQGPVLVLRTASDQRFTIVINGQDRRPISGETIVDDLQPGTHQIEFRSEDQTVVWVRGTLDLEPGEAISLFVEEGRMVTTTGAEDSWRPEGGR